MQKLGIVTFENGQQGVTCYNNATSIKTLAIEHLKSVMEAEGYQVNDLKGYLEGWAETLSEIKEDNGDDAISDIMQYLDEVAENLVYCNTHFVILASDGVWESIGNGDKNSLYDAMIEVLEQGFANDKQVAFMNAIKGTQFEKDLTNNLKINNANSTKGHWNLIVSIRDCKLWANIGMKPNRNWKVSQVKAYFGIKGNKNSLVEQLENYKSILLNE